MNPPAISICIPAYQEPELMAKCLESIALQTYTDYEVVITDDSPDESVSAVVDAFKGKITNLRYYKNTERKGSPGNWNECVRKAEGSYIKILHRDDRFSDADSLARFMAAAEANPEVGFFFSGAMSDDHATHRQYAHTPNKRRIAKLKKDLLLLLVGNVIGAPSVTLFKRSAALLFDENLKWLVDIDFYIRMLEKGDFIYLEEPLVTVSAGGTWQVTRNCTNKKVEFGEWFYVHKKFKPGKMFTTRELVHLLKLAYKYRKELL